jgi:hypothetical protein
MERQYNNMSRETIDLCAQADFDKFMWERREEIERMKPKKVREEMRTLRESHHDIYQWIFSLENLNTSIWCSKCKKAGQIHAPDPTMRPMRPAHPLSWHSS